MEKKILYNVLKEIWRESSSNSAPDKEYLKALETIGLIKIGWETTLTDFGYSIYQTLKNQIEDRREV